MKGFIRRNYIFFILVAVLPVVFLFTVSVGSVAVPFGETISAIVKMLKDAGNHISNYLFGTDFTDSAGSIHFTIINLRIPRVILAALVGAALAVSGAVTQGVFRNPLAEGSTLGISSGAALGAVLFIALGSRLPFSGALWNQVGISMMSILFAFLSLLFILYLSYNIDRNLSVNTIILTGVIFSMFAGSIISFLTTFSGDRLRQIVFWSMGSFSGKNYSDILLLLPFVTAGILAMLKYSRELDIFTFGEEQARYIGVNTKKIKIIVFIAVSAMIGVSVSVSGTIAFVGLVIPHIMRKFTGQNFRRLIPGCAAGGAIFLMLTDLLGRTVISPSELPIGVVTSFVGSVVFLYVFYSRANQRKRLLGGGGIQ